MAVTIATTMLTNVIFPAANNVTGGETISGTIEQIYNGAGVFIAVDSTIVMTEHNALNQVATETFSTGGTVSNTATITSTDANVNGSPFIQNHGNIPSSTFTSYELFMPETAKSVPAFSNLPTWDEIHLDWLEIPTLTNSPFLYAGSNSGRETVLEYGGNPNLEVLGNQLGTETTTYEVLCFLAGTRILTVAGETAVEAIKAGDQIVLHDGSTAPAMWIGKRTLDASRHNRPDAVLPVRIAAGALGDGLPLRDLYVSPDHALLLDGHLVPAKALVNGVSIRTHKMARLSYYHIELPAHAVLYAEGAPAESYLDTGNRNGFENGGGAMELHPDFAQTLREQNGCAPFAEAGPVVEAIRARLLTRARIVMTQDPALEIEISGGAATIRSRSAIPGELTADPRDRRVLGVKVAALRADGRNIPVNHPALTEGWHGMEADGRWTDGHAVVPACLLHGAATLEVTLAATLPYRVEQAA